MENAEKRICEEVDSLLENMRYGKEVKYNPEYERRGLYAVGKANATVPCAAPEVIRQYSGSLSQIEAELESLYPSQAVDANARAGVQKSRKQAKSSAMKRGFRLVDEKVSFRVPFSSPV